jgi:hypothetical protein
MAGAGNPSNGATGTERKRGPAVSITKDDVISFMNDFHDTVMLRKGTAAEQAAFFLYPDEARVFVPHGEDISLQSNYEIHQKLTDEVHIALDPWDITPLSDEPERVRASGAVYWEGRLVNSTDALIKCVVGEDWIVQREPAGDLKIALYINPYHHFLPDSAQLDLQ